MNRLQALKRLYRRKRVLEDLKKIKAPDLLIKSAHKLYSKAIKLLKKYGIQAENFLNSPEGMVQFLLFNVDCDTRQKNEKRCGKCRNYFFKDKEPKCGCYKHLNYSDRIICNDFLDTNLEFDTRITKLLVDRCFTCEHIIVNKIFKKSVDYCKKGLNRINPDCFEYKPKKIKRYESN